MTTAVVDNTILSNFAHVEKPELLRAAFDKWMVLTDDRDARQTARNAGVLVSGTLGALMNLVHHEIVTLTDCDVLLAQMKRHGYHCPINSLSELDDAGE